MNLKSKLKKVFIVAEIGNNHEGKLETALNLIDQACAAGADAVKFQTFKAENFISSSEKERFDRLKSFQLSYEEFEKIANYAKKKNNFFFNSS
jgi:sialic acid synthase SpsE